MTCKTCKFYDLARVQNKAGRIQKGWAAPCLWRFDYPLPASISNSGFRSMPSPRFMEPDEGNGCPVWQARP